MDGCGAVHSLHLCEAAVHKQFRPRDKAAVIGSEKNHRLGDLVGCTKQRDLSELLILEVSQGD